MDSAKQSMRLNLCCGRDYKAGWQNWDISKEVKAEAYLDISKDPFPAKDAEFDQIYCSGVLEQILANEGLKHALNESWRVLKPSGSMTVIVPSAKFSNAFKDPFDVRQFTEPTFKYLDYSAQEYKLYGSVYGFRPFKIESIFTNEQGIITAVLQKHV